MIDERLGGVARGLLPYPAAVIPQDSPFALCVHLLCGLLRREVRATLFRPHALSAVSGLSRRRTVSENRFHRDESQVEIQQRGEVLY